MGRKSASGGVTNYRGKCRVDFSYEGRRYQPVLDLEHNARNVRATQKLMEIVRAKIAHGVFDPTAYFPDYAGLKRMAVVTSKPSAKTFRDYSDLWQGSIGEKAAATREDYKKILNRVWLPSLGDKPIAAIRYSDLLVVLAEFPAMTGKTRNNNLIPLRGVLRLRRRITRSTTIRPRSSRTPRSKCPNLIPSSCTRSSRFWLTWLYPHRSQS